MNWLGYRGFFNVCLRIQKMWHFSNLSRITLHLWDDNRSSEFVNIRLGSHDQHKHTQAVARVSTTASEDGCFFALGNLSLAVMHENNVKGNALAELSLLEEL